MDGACVGFVCGICCCYKHPCRLGLGNGMHGLHDSVLNSHWTYFPLYFGLDVGLLYIGIFDVVFVVVRVSLQHIIG